MYQKSKYVVGEVYASITSMKVAVVFPETMMHSDVASVFISGTITSAGFCHCDDYGVVIYGESTSLKIKAQASDEELVGRAMAHPKYSR